MERKIIVFDLDNTVLNDYGELTDFTLKVLFKLRSRGHLLVINTARSYSFALDLINVIKPDYAIVNGGAQIVNNQGQNIYLKPIEKSTLNIAIHEIKKFSRYIAVQTLHNLYTDSDKFIRQNPLKFDFAMQEFTEDVYKILCDIPLEMDAFIIAKKLHLDYVSYYDTSFKVFRHFDTGKDKGLLNLLKIINCNPLDCIGFGDDEGDIEFLKSCGIGVIMKNANEKYHLNELTISKYNNDEDGVARFLANYFNLIV